VKDVVEANRLALETEYTKQAYNIGTGRATSIRDVCEYCIKAMGSDLKMKIVRARVFDYPIFVYDISRTRTLLGLEPKWNVLNGITDMVKEL
jgi:nucleoside-diphosphate-sugar epimerase